MSRRVVNPCSSALRAETVARAARNDSGAFKMLASYPPFAGSSPWRKMCVCESISPGRTVSSERSMMVASAGTFAAPASETLSILFPRMVMIWSRRGLSDFPSINTPARITVTFAACDAPWSCGNPALTSISKTAWYRIFKSASWDHPVFGFGWDDLARRILYPWQCPRYHDECLNGRVYAVASREEPRCRSDHHGDQFRLQQG